MKRGDVYLVPAMYLPDRDAGTGMRTLQKLAVVLQGAASPTWSAETDVAVVVASTNRRAPGAAQMPYEVWVGPQDGFRNDSIIDCRWPFTMFKADLGRKLLTLPPDRMEEVNVAMIAGLQMA